jgi:rhodanese-related sulfurtransferase
MAQQEQTMQIPFKTVQGEEAKQMIESGEYQLIDIRMPKSYEKGHIPGSALVPLPELLQKPWEHLGQDKVIFICEVGQSSQVACEIAAALGLTEVFNLGGGIQDWIKRGYPIETGPGKSG